MVSISFFFSFVKILIYFSSKFDLHILHFLYSLIYVIKSFKKSVSKFELNIILSLFDISFSTTDFKLYICDKSLLSSKLIPLSLKLI